MTNVVLGCDYSFSHPDPHVLFASGYRYVFRYVGPGSGTKMLTADEVAAIHQASLGLGLLAEGATSDVLGGSIAGVNQAAMAVLHRARLGLPNDNIIYYSADIDITADNINRAVDYFHGVAQVQPRTEYGCYGDLDIIEKLFSLGLCDNFILAQAASSWSHGLAIPSYVELRQYRNGVNIGGGQIDEIASTGMPDGLSWNTRKDSDVMRYIFGPGVGGDGKHVYVTDGLRYRVQPVSYKVDSWAAASGAGNIVTVNELPDPKWTLDILINALCGSPDPGDHPSADAVFDVPIDVAFTGTITPHQIG